MSFTLRNLNIIRGVLPTGLYQNFMQHSVIILDCLNNNLHTSTVDSDNVSERVAEATLEMLILASKYKLIRSNIISIKREILVINADINNTIIKTTDDYSRLVINCKKSEISIKKDVKQSYKLERESVMSLIRSIYNKLMVSIEPLLVQEDNK